MNVWRQGSLFENPYYRTPFRIAGVPRETVKRRTIVQLIGSAKRVAQADPDAHQIQGESVTQAEINVAEQMLLDPKKRIVYELLEHATERPPLDRVRLLHRQSLESLAEQPAAPPPTNLSGLRPWASDLVDQFLHQAPVADPSFGAFETRLVPPFGQIEES